MVVNYALCQMDGNCDKIIFGYRATAIPMTTNKLPKKKDKKTPIPQHPLAKLAGKFEGEFWEDTILEIQKFRDLEKQEINNILDSK
jgi:hypothetical protein